MKTAILALSVLTGFSGLVFQVAWQRYFSFVLGGEALSSAMVVSVFLAGLSLGYALFGRWARGRGPAQIVRAAGAAELGIGAWALLFPLLFQGLWSVLGQLPATGSARTAVDIGLTVVFLFPATVLMGSTLPLLTRGLADSDEELRHVHARLYGLNTLGAFFGAVIAGFFLMEAVGLAWSLVVLSAFNVLAGVAMIHYARSLREDDIAASAVDTVVTRSPVSWVAVVLALLAGFVSIGTEVLLIRSVSLAVGGSEYAYSLVVGVFVLMIALGTLSLGWRKAKTPDLFINQVWLTLGLVVVYLTVPYWGWLAFLIRLSVPANFAVYSACVFVLLSAFIALPAFFMGRAMPLLFAQIKSSTREAAPAVGRLYAANTVGCCLGGLIMGYVFLLHFEAAEVFRFGILISGLALIIVGARYGSATLNRGVRWALTVLVITSSLVLPEWNRMLLTSGLFRTRGLKDIAPPTEDAQTKSRGRLIYFRDDPNTNVAVLEDLLGYRSLLVNGKADGSTFPSDMTTTTLLGHLPALFTPVEGRAAVIGLGLGVTPNGLAKYPNITHVDVFEIAEGVIEAQELFPEANGAIRENPKVSIHHMDAFRGLMSSRERYATIVSEPSNPWVSGVDRLYSKEFYAAVRAKLLPGGVFAQWIHSYELSLDTFAIVMRTLSQTFPHIRIFFNTSDIIVLGSDRPWSEDHWRLGEARWAANPAREDLIRLGLASVADLGLFETFYPQDVAQSAPEHSLFRPKLAFAAARDFYYNRRFDLTTLQIMDPVFSLHSRRRWDQSLLARPSARTPQMEQRSLASCTSIKGKVAEFKVSGLGALCQSRLVDMIAKDPLKPTGAVAGFLGAASLLGEMAKTGFKASVGDLEDHQRLLEVYPLSRPAPPTDYLRDLEQRCSGSEHPEECRVQIARQAIKFGYFEFVEEVRPRQSAAATRLVQELETARRLR